MDPNIGANQPEEQRRRLHENFDPAVPAVRREEAARRDEEQPHNQGDHRRGRAVQSPENPTHDPAQVQRHQWSISILSACNMDYSDALQQAIAEMRPKRDFST